MTGRFRGAAAVSMHAVRERSLERLEQVLAARLPRDRHIRRIDCRPSAHRSSFFLDDIDVVLDDGSTLALIAKAIDWNGLSGQARLAKPAFLWDGTRERATYESILAGFDLDTARCFGSYVDAAGIRYLLLERLEGVPLWQYGDLEAWREAARWLARLHAQVPVDEETHPAAAHLLKYDRQFYGCWMRRAWAFHGGAEQDLAPLSDRHPRVVDWLAAERTTFIHGEFYAANVLVDDRGRQRAFRVRPVDWEMAALGPALMDLACLLAGRWTDEERADVANAYFDEIAAAGGRVATREQDLKTLDCCLVHLSVRNLGWSRDWSPPPDRAHDWLNEALRLCDKWQL